MIELTAEEKAWAVADALIGYDVTAKMEIGVDADAEIDRSKLYFLPFSKSGIGGLTAPSDSVIGICQRAGIHYLWAHGYTSGPGIVVRICHAQRLVDLLNARKP